MSPAMRTGITQRHRFCYLCRFKGYLNASEKSPIITSPGKLVLFFGMAWGRLVRDVPLDKERLLRNCLSCTGWDLVLRG